MMPQDYYREVFRKIFHVLGFLFCFLIYSLHSKIYALNTILLIFASTIALIDYYKIYLKFNKYPVVSFLTKCTRSNEQQKYTLSGTSWYVIGICIINYCILDKNVVIIAISILAFCDSVSSISGIFSYRSENKLLKIFDFVYRFCTFMLTGIMIIQFYSTNFKIIAFNTNYYLLYWALFFSYIVDLVFKPLRIVDDNFLIPVSFVLYYEFFL